MTNTEKNVKTNSASDNEAKVNIDEMLMLMEKAKSAVLESLNRTRLKFLDHSKDLVRLGAEDDYAEALLFVLENAVNRMTTLASIAPMFPDVAKRNAARQKLKNANLIKETKKGTSVIIELLVVE